MGGVFNTVNLHLYHYAGNNPVKYVDPDGNLTIDFGVYASAGAGVGGSVADGFSIGISLDKGFTFGIFTSEDIGADFFGHAELGFSFSPNIFAKKVESSVTNQLNILACLVVFAFTFIMFYLITFWHLFFLISYYPIVLIINILFLYLTGFDINYKKIALSFLLVLFIMLYSLFFVIVLCINSGTNDILFSTRLIFMKPTLLIKNGVIIAGLVFFEIMILKIFKSK